MCPKQLPRLTVEEAAKKFPKTPTRTLARLIYGKNPLLFKDAEHVRTILRTVRNVGGNKQREQNSQPVPYSFEDCNFSQKLPEGLKHFSDWGNYDLAGDMRIGVMGDLHMPYHDKDAMVMTLRHLKKRAITHLILNGDTADFFSISFWQKDPRKRDLPGEVKTLRAFFELLREEFPKTTIIFKEGNHEERWFNYLTSRAPEVLGLPEFELKSVLALDKQGIIHVGDKRPIKAGKLYIIHGHEFRWGITSPVNPARGFYMRGKENCIGGHLHTSSSHSESSMAGTAITCWSSGCLCDLHPDYNPINTWNHGFAEVEVTTEGTFNVHNYKLIDNVIHTA